MKRSILFACLAAFLAICIVVRVKSAAIPGPANLTPPASSQGKLVLHEWGTFTSFSGSDGIALPFNTLIGSDLPGFVMNRQKFGERADPKLKMALAFVKAGGASALVRMETPVLYFYSDVEREVDVRVDFPKGSLTEFFPPIRAMGPRYGLGLGEFDTAAAPAAPAGAGKAAAPANPPAASFLDWGRVRIMPPPAGDVLSKIPPMANQNHYQFARDTDSALVEFTDPAGPKQYEKFLFYRGLGNFSLPVGLIAKGNDTFEIKNAGSSPIASAFLIERDFADHALLRFSKFENLAGRQTLALSPKRATESDLSEAIVASLMAGGLYEKEARAMVATWKASWLDEPGDRLLYLLPRPQTDDMLPLRLAPVPDGLQRVFVGRLDLLTPENEARLKSLMSAATETGVLADADVRLLQGLGRFYWPALEYIGKSAGVEHEEQLAGELSRMIAGKK